MLESLRKKAITLASPILLVAFLSMSAVTASANENTSEKPSTPEPASTERAEKTEKSEASESGQPTISYILFAGAMKVDPAPSNRPRYATPEKYTEVLNRSESGPSQEPPPQLRKKVATAPMTVGEKFNFFVKGAFYPPGPYIQPLFTSSINELFDNDEGKKDTVGNYVADTLSRAARSFAFSVTSKFLEDFTLASAFRQDPRYHRAGSRQSTSARIKYAVSRVFVTRGNNGNDQFNASFLLGGAMTAAISNVWEREENRTTAKSFKRWGFHIGFSALGNIAAEFLGGQ